MMIQSAADIDNAAELKQWLFKENVKLENAKAEFSDAVIDFEREKQKFLKMEQETNSHNRILQEQLRQEKELFEKKWKILERELRQLAKDKKQVDIDRQIVARQKEQYRKLNADAASRTEYKSNIKPDIFFKGVNSELALKKRYKDLLKIYHPDNMNGDKDVLQAINAEYNYLKHKYEN